jgi:glycosyltransferase involved in cell wall biosynthesis/hydrogenase maturation factor
MNLETYKKNYYFYSSLTFEPWDYTNPITQGIGGSEVSHIEMCSRLSQRGHNVISYAPVPWDDDFRINRDVTWKHFLKCTFKDDGIYVIYRDPEALDNFNVIHENKIVYFVAQDVFYSKLNEERASKIDKFICLCSDHAHYVEAKHPYLKDKIVISSNGISSRIIDAIEKNNKIERNPYRLIYSSSPDRGLEQLIPIFKRVKEFIPELELHIFYGFDNINKVIEKNPFVAKMRDSIMNGINSTDGIFWHGRVGQYELIIEWLKSTFWCYPINFTETSCISCMEAQACGVIPIVSPVWALAENVMHGVFVNGDIEDKLTLNRFAGEIIRLCKDENLRNRITKDIKMDARVRFNWERYVDQWESWIFQPDCRYFYSQYAFQQKWAFGDILNVGCDDDSSDFKGLRDAINFDVEQNEKNSVDIIGDARDNMELHFVDEQHQVCTKFDTVIVGDLIEHLNHEDAIKILKNAKEVLKDNEESRIIITCPSDPRTKEEQNPTLDVNSSYVGGVSHFHRYIDEDELLDIIEESGLKLEVAQIFDATHYTGFGAVCSIKREEN